MIFNIIRENEMIVYYDQNGNEYPYEKGHKKLLYEIMGFKPQRIIKKEIIKTLEGGSKEDIEKQFNKMVDKFEIEDSHNIYLKEVN